MLLGGICGAMAAILYAPASGSDTRRGIKRTAREASADLSGAASALAGDTEKHFKSAADEIGYRVGSTLARGVVTVDTAIGAIESQLAKLRKANKTTKAKSDGKKVSASKSGSSVAETVVKA